ncbi:hypothetical protein ACQEXU_21085 [Vibrio sp. TRT 21S02]|uniref:hypothetical protein n=1 Tax=unclassified Vibrio TaxID=2614977 RepID=UPI003CEF95D3
MLKKIAMILFVLITASGCATQSNHMVKVAPENAITKPEEGKALVHFMRPSSFGGAIQSTVYDDSNYIGTVSAKTRLAYQAEPGKHMFMVIGENADFLEAELLADKIYYILVSARMGVWKARFSLNPASGEVPQEQIDNWFNSTSEVVVNESGLNWAKEKEKEIESLRSKYLPKWQQKDEEDKQRIKAESGI